MRRWMMSIPILLVALTGCQSLEEQSDDYARAHAYTVQSNIEEVVQRDTTKWDQLTAQLDGLGTQVENKDSYTEAMGIWEYDGIFCLPDVHELKEEDKEKIKQAIGQEATEFIEASKSLKIGESTERIINGYGIYATNCYGNGVQVYIAQSGLKFKDEMMQNMIEAYCGDELLISAVSKGEEKQIVELAYPSYLAYNKYGVDMGDPAYYKLIMDQNGNVERIKMIISYRVDENITFSEEKKTDLKRILEIAVGKTLDTTKVESAIEENMASNGKNSKGTIEEWNYSVEKMDKNSRYTGTTVVEFERNDL